MNILVATPCYGGLVSMNYMVSLIELCHRGEKDGIGVGTYFLGNESLVTRARNNCASFFLKSEIKYDKLMFIDADISWRYEQALAVIKSKKHVIGGLYPVKKLPISLNFKPIKQHLPYFKGISKTIEEFNQYVSQENNEENEIPVEYLANGFMCIDRAVFECFAEKAPKYIYPDLSTGKLEEHWDFFRAGSANGEFLSEDYFFCKQAEKFGFQPYMNPKCLVNHEGTYMFKV